MVWVELDGSERPVEADLPTRMTDLQFSPDGTRLAISAGPYHSGDIWVHDFRQGVTTRVTTEPSQEFRPGWTHDGRVTFVSGRTGTRAVYARTVDGRDPAELVVQTDRFVQQAVWRDDGLMLYREGFSDGATLRDIYLRLPGDTVDRPFLVTDWDEHSPEISPDGSG